MEEHEKRDEEAKETEERIPPEEGEEAHHKKEDAKEHHHKETESHAHSRSEHEKADAKTHSHVKEAEETRHHPKEEKHEKKGGGSPLSKDERNVRDSRISVSVFTLAGIGMGLAASLIKFDLLSVIAGFILLAVLSYMMKNLLKKKAKFFLGDAMAYLFVWLVTWVFLFNMNM